MDDIPPVDLRHEPEHSLLVKEMIAEGRIISPRVTQTHTPEESEAQAVMEPLRDALARQRVLDIAESKRRLGEVARRLRDFGGGPNA